MKNNNELSKEFQSKTGQKFDDFYHKYKPKLIWYLTKYTKDEKKSEDFADDAFTQALIKIGNFDKEKSQIHTWVYKIGENLVKKDFKDRKRMSVFSLDKDNSDNLNLINIIPNSDVHDKHEFETDHMVIKKAEIVKDAILKLPEKYKKVMLMREIENRPYLEIAEMCTKDYPIFMKKNKLEMPDPVEFLDLVIENKGNDYCYINFSYNDNEQLQMVVKPGKLFKFNKSDIENISKVEIESTDIIEGLYRTTTNLSTIKSQISKGRQLIQSMVKKKFKELEENGIE